MGKQLGTFYIITDDQKNDDIVLFLVDRSKHSISEGGRKWWTHHIEEAIAFVSRDAANEQVKKYTYGNPRVIDENQARQCATYNRDWLAEQRRPMDLEE